jgi:hypothetical protein
MSATSASAPKTISAVVCAPELMENDGYPTMTQNIVQPPL